MSDALAVVVGIDHYPDQMLGGLDGAVNDAEEFCAWLQTAGAGSLVYDPQDEDATEIYKVVTTARGPNPLNARPMLSDVEQALDFVRYKSEQRLTEWEQGNGTPYKRLYLFFAGHGIGPDIEQAALLMANAGVGRFRYYLQGRPYANYFRERASFDEVLLFMDCCRDSYPFLAAQGIKWEPPTPSGRDTNHCYGFATKWSKKARETNVGGKPRGFFSAALMEALKGSAADASGVVRARDIAGYVRTRVKALVKQAEAKTKKKLEIQRPDFSFPDDNPMVVVDYGAAAAPQLLTRANVALTPAETGAPLQVLDGELKPAALIDESRPAADVWTFRLPFGMYLLKNHATGHSANFEVVGPEDVHVTF